MSRDGERLTSVGVDVGTTTTQIVVSRLRVSEPTHDGAAAPEIRDREVIHRSAVHTTPLRDPKTVDIERVAALVENAFTAAGITPADVDTGAVIVTGETAKRRNAEPLVHQIADDAGNFVAAAAGAALEAVLAGRGSGAADHARSTGRTVANVDVGGGTTNVATFGPDGVVDTRCLDVGARIVRIEDGRIAALSPTAERLRSAHGLEIAVGDPASVEGLRPLAETAADAITELLVGPPFAPLVESLAIGTLPDASVAIDDVVVTGGVGSLVNESSTAPDTDPFRYGDLGPLLASAIGDAICAHSELPETPVVLAEDLRATVVGVGTESTTFSGRTVWLPVDSLPLRDVPVVAVDPSEAGDTPDSSADQDTRFERAVRTARELYDLTDIDGVALYIPEIGSLAYDDLRETADQIADALGSVGVEGSTDTDGSADLPVVVVTRENCANVLGQLLSTRTDRPIAVVDELRLEEGGRLDIGEPVGGRDAVPVVVKTLAFGQ